MTSQTHNDQPFPLESGKSDEVAVTFNGLPSAKPRVWPVFTLLAIVIAAIFIAQIAVVVPLALWHLGQGVKPEELPPALVASLSQPAAFVGLAALSQAILGGGALIAAWLSPVPLVRRLGFMPPAWGLWDTCIVIVGAIVPLAIGVGSAYALAEVVTPDSSVKKVYESMTTAWAPWFVLFIALGPGFCEEMLFRGYMQRRLIERWGPALALIVTSIIFGLFHMTPHAIAAAFPLGVWLGLMAWRSGSIWPGIACHALVNGFWNLRGMAIRFELLDARPPIAVLVGGLAVGVVAFGWALGIMFARPATNTPATSALPAP
jgi:membrane protease YdiL (CAAX protease family)